MAFGYDITTKLNQHQVIERVTCAVNAINVLDVFYSCYTVILAVCQAYVVQLLYHVSDLLPSIYKCVNDSSIHYT